MSSRIMTIQLGSSLRSNDCAWRRLGLRGLLRDTRHVADGGIASGGLGCDFSPCLTGLGWLPGMPFLERGEQGVPDHMVEGCFAGVILHSCGEQGVECRRAGRYGAFSSHSAERFDGVGEGWMARGGLARPARGRRSRPRQAAGRCARVRGLRQWCARTRQAATRGADP
jgi:hypothetical protein